MIAARKKSISFFSQLHDSCLEIWETVFGLMDTSCTQFRENLLKMFFISSLPRSVSKNLKESKGQFLEGR